MELAANSGYIKITDQTFLNNRSAFSVSFWWYPTAVTGGEALVSKWITSPERGWMIYRFEKVLYFYIDGNSTVQKADAFPTANTWYHVAGTYDGTTYKLYVNGVVVAEGAATGTKPTAAPVDINIHGYNNGSELPSTVRVFDVRFYDNKALTAGDIALIMQHKNGTGADCILPFQGSSYDIVGNRHGVEVGTCNRTTRRQDEMHYNIIHGFDRYYDTATGLIELCVPYSPITKLPVVSSVSGYTKSSSNPPYVWHNGAETKLMIGAGTFDGTGYPCANAIKTADTEEHLHTAATGYCKQLAYGDLVSVFDGNYIFCDVRTANKYKNLLVYNAPQVNMDDVNTLKFVGKTDFVLDENWNYIFDDNGFVVTEE